MIDLKSIKLIPLVKKAADLVRFDEGGPILCCLQEIHLKYKKANTTDRPQGINRHKLQIRLEISILLSPKWIEYIDRKAARVSKV